MSSSTTPRQLAPLRASSSMRQPAAVTSTCSLARPGTGCSSIVHSIGRVSKNGASAARCRSVSHSDPLPPLASCHPRSAQRRAKATNSATKSRCKAPAFAAARWAVPTAPRPAATASSKNPMVRPFSRFSYAPMVSENLRPTAHLPHKSEAPPKGGASVAAHRKRQFYKVMRSNISGPTPHTGQRKSSGSPSGYPSTM